MKALYTIYITLLAFVVTACSEGLLSDPLDPAVPEGTPVTIRTGATFPEMNFGPSSRSMGDEPTADELLNSLKVNVFVFDQAGIFLQFIGPEDVQIERIDAATKHVYFKVSNIYSSVRPRRLHFVIADTPDLRDMPGGEYIQAMASETSTMPALMVKDNIDAYWGIKELDEIADNMELNVKLIRNFVKINVQSMTDESQFKLLGYTVVNRPSIGTVVPFIHRDHLFASFLAPDNSLMGYDEIISQGYYGVNPAGSEYTMTHTTEQEVAAELAVSERLLASGAGDGACYIYERSQSSIESAGSGVRVTYIILVGEYRGKRCYYKVDIGRDKEGKFEFYDLLRNFQYTLQINEVGGEGSPSLIDAMNGAANNNLSASVVTRDLFSIGYEGEKIEVSSTRVIFTEHTDDYVFRFRYTTPNGTPFEPEKLKIYDIEDEAIEFNVEGATATTPKVISLPGQVIENAKIYAAADGWYELHIDSNDIPNDSRRLEQNIRIYYKGGSAGLGRTVTFMLRRPWNFGSVATTNPTAAAFSDMSIKLPIPSGLSKSQFPLIITFESDKQNIYAVPGTQLTVTTGKSKFAGATVDRVISYERRIEWAEYEDKNLVLNLQFRVNTTSADDILYNTAGIDAIGYPGRNANNGTTSFSVRIDNKGMKYIEPIYVNFTR